MTWSQKRRRGDPRVLVDPVGELLLGVEAALDELARDDRVEDDVHPHPGSRPQSIAMSFSCQYRADARTRRSPRRTKTVTVLSSFA